MYDYQTERKNLFTEEGLKTVLTVKSKIDYACSIAGAVTRERAFDTGSCWTSMAAQDFLEECGYVRISRSPDTFAQHETIRIRGS